MYTLTFLTKSGTLSAIEHKSLAVLMLFKHNVVTAEVGKNVRLWSTYNKLIDPKK